MKGCEMEVIFHTPSVSSITFLLNLFPPSPLLSLVSLLRAGIIRNYNPALGPDSKPFNGITPIVFNGP